MGCSPRAVVDESRAPDHRTMTSGGRTMSSGARTTTTGGPTMTASWRSYLACSCPPRSPPGKMHPVVERRVTMPVNNRILFISGDLTSWARTSPWGITRCLPPLLEPPGSAGLSRQSFRAKAGVPPASRKPKNQNSPARRQRSQELCHGSGVQCAIILFGESSP